MSKRVLTAGCSWCSTTTTCRPFGSVWTWYGGNFTSRAGSGRGGLSEGHRVWAETDTAPQRHKDTEIKKPPSHRATERLGFDARREAPATRPNAVVHESAGPSRDSCTTRGGGVLGLLRGPTRRTRAASTP